MNQWLRRLLVAILSAVIGIPLIVTVGIRQGLIGPSPVPEALIARSVTREGPEMDDAQALPNAPSYRGLWSQSNGSLCGPASLVNVERSLGHEIADEHELLAGSGVCRLDICWMGLTLDELAALARAKTSRKVTILRDLSPEQFLEHLRASNDPDKRYIVNFHRTGVFGEGGGHHSPIGGYLEERDRVLVLDVNAHYGPWLVARDRLYDAIDTLDGENKRGLLLLE